MLTYILQNVWHSVIKYVLQCVACYHLFDLFISSFIISVAYFNKLAPYKPHHVLRLHIYKRN